MKNLLLVFCFLISLQNYAQDSSFSGFLKVEGKNIVNDKDENVVLRGFGLGGYMLQEGYMLKVPFSGQQYVFREHVQELIGNDKTEEFYSSWRKNFMQKQDVDSLKKWGFNSIRLPMHYNLFTLPVEDEPEKGKNTWLEEGFKLTDQLVSWCRDNEIYLILDMHATPGGQGHDVNISDRDPSKASLWESKDNREKLTALWVKLAERYKDEPVIGAYDLINEPNWTFEEGKNKNGTEDSQNVLLWDYQKKLTEAIREIDNNHIIIIEGNGWGNNYNGLIDLWDDNLVMSFHKYWTYNTTESIQNFLDYRENLNIPIWLGESGENSNVWFTDAIGLMEANNIGWCWWPLKKIGFNNPLEIKVNPGYKEILNYWRGEASKPSEEEAYEAFMQLAENTKIENCIIHHDVIDAMIRQTSSKKSMPFKNIRIENQGELKAVNYDLGREGFAYKDSISANYHVSTGKKRQNWNNGRYYRNDGVDIFKKENAAAYDDVYVGDLEIGDWMQYTFTANDAGNYMLAIRVSSQDNLGRAIIEINGVKLETLEIPSTAGEWKWINLNTIPLKKGKNQLRFIAIKSGFNLETIRLQKQ
ncbi:cellulase family glycosylhydrolase [Christiangramia echinicola]|uniref:Cellulase (Glycosyl hydrolase family 5) n=1 Tax=Christiangramia echinicola TaxID=279359 RepID=A0A1H1MKK6_9FLAO|nr:cellulase family glycosylhydrolase [Christiangramia echinicola]SDR87160.1 Cellulase (glycosyl hydrolase family 5) [Christiangramia echinicola]